MRLSVGQVFVGFIVLFLVGVLLDIVTTALTTNGGKSVIVSTIPGRRLVYDPTDADFRAYAERPWANQLYLANMN